jgi:hypothetical protein
MTAQSTAAPELIVMLTYEDQTVSDAHELFQGCRGLGALRWGFKNVGLPANEMRRLAESMKEAGCSVYLEVVSLNDEEALEAVEVASSCGCDALMGSVYSPTIHKAAQSHDLAYLPFVGDVSGHPSVLEGTVESITDDAKRLSALGVDGMDLLTYRFEGDTNGLLHAVVAASSVPVVSAGSIDSYQRIETVWDAGAWGFTIGSAFFDARFAQAPFRDNLAHVLTWLAEEEARRYEGHPRAAGLPRRR